MVSRGTALEFSEGLAATGPGVSSQSLPPLRIVDGQRWHVVHTQPHAEMRAVAHLERQGFETFCPSVRRTISHARKKSTVLAALFPNYVFVRFDPDQDQWRRINGTRGVVRLISHGEVPSAVPDGVVAELQLRTGEDGALDWTSSLRIGDQVKISEGPFTDLIGTLEHLDASGRIRVLLNLLGRSVSVALQGRKVMPAR